jgi:hypothetical protein
MTETIIGEIELVNVEPFKSKKIKYKEIDFEPIVRFNKEVK